MRVCAHGACGGQSGRISSRWNYRCCEPPQVGASSECPLDEYLLCTFNHWAISLATTEDLAMPRMRGGPLADSKECSRQLAYSIARKRAWHGSPSHKWRTVYTSHKPTESPKEGIPLCHGQKWLLEFFKVWKGRNSAQAIWNFVFD